MKRKSFSSAARSTSRTLLLAAAGLGTLAAVATPARAAEGPPAAVPPAVLSPAVERQVADLPPFRYANAHLVVPPGWNKALSGKVRYIIEHKARLKGENGNPKTERLTIEFGPAFEVNGDLRQIYDADVAYFKKERTNYRDDSLTERRSKPGYRTLIHRFTVDAEPGWKDVWATDYYTIVHVDGGPLSQSFIFQTSNAAMRDRFRPDLDALVDSVRPPSAIELAAAPAAVGKSVKPLTLYTVYQMTDFLEWMLEMPFTEGQRLQVRDYLIDAWRRGDKDEMAAPDEIAKFRAQVDELKEDQRDVARQLVKAEALKEWRKDAAEKHDKAASWILALYNAANAPLAKGANSREPDLTRQAADATLETMYFMASKAAGVDATPDAARKDAWAKQAAATYASLSADQKKTVADMPLTWAALRVGWAQLPFDQQKQSAEQWAKVPAVGELAKQIKANRDAQGKAFRDLQMYYESKFLSADIMRRTDYFRSQTMSSWGSSSSYRY
ncbi:MAG: hypothetical protein JWO31_3108 [Phycisphaerales bacterium]|nr:hypothetical protein [Phycisphaerales bacterium]